MANVLNVVSKRSVDDRAFFDVCYEWEDIIAEHFNTHIKGLDRLRYLYKKISGKVFPNKYSLQQNLRNPVSLYFVMSYTDLKYYDEFNGIPIFIDIWSDEAIKFIDNKLGNKLFFVTSLDVYRALKILNERSGVVYFPLSVSDKYYSEYFSKYEKQIDIVQVGRRNDTLHEWAIQYCADNPSVEYVYSQYGSTDGRLSYISTKRGEIGEFRTRDAYIGLLSSAKISLLSSPGIDNSRSMNIKRIDYPTPRFYESAILGCYMIGRYQENEENNMIGIQRVCDFCSNYERFVDLVGNGLSIDQKELFENNRDFIHENLTSIRARYIEKVINDRV